VLVCVINFCRFHSATPFHIDRNLCANRKDPWLAEGRGRNSQPLRQRVSKIVIIENVQATQTEAGVPAGEVNLDGVVTHRNHPEHEVAVNMHVVIMDLCGNRKNRSNWSGVQVESNKGERAPMQSAIRPDEFALAETHISTEGQSRSRALRGVCPGSATMNIR